MKKLLLLVFVCIATSSFAQVKVDSIGRVTNGDTINAVYPPTFGPRRHGTLEDQTTIWAYGDYNKGLAVYANTRRCGRSDEHQLYRTNPSAYSSRTRFVGKG